MSRTQGLKQWGFWPIILLAFIYPVNNALIGLAIPLYFYQIGIPLEIVGLLAAASAITYCFSPLLFSRIADRLGRKKSVILGMAGVAISQLIYYITLEPIPFFISRLLEGLFLGFYWMSLQSCISDNSLQDHSKMMSNYNISWNAGLLFGNLLGAIFLFLMNSIFLIFYISPIIVLVDLFVAISIFKEGEKVDLERGNTLREQNHIQENKRTDLPLTKYVIPMMIPILLVLSHSISKAGVNFLYPIRSVNLGFDGYTVYLFTFFCLITQLIGTSTATFYSIKNLKRIPLVYITGLIIVLIFYGIATELTVFIILFFLLGFFCGSLYGFALKIFMVLNMKRKTSRYSALLESVIGTAFFLTPLIAGILAFLGIFTVFFLLALILMLFLGMTAYFTRKFHEDVKNDFGKKMAPTPGVSWKNESFSQFEPGSQE